jgi:hypothetical protein
MDSIICLLRLFIIFIWMQDPAASQVSLDNKDALGSVQCSLMIRMESLVVDDTQGSCLYLP